MSPNPVNKRSIILTETVNGLTPILLLFSLFLTFRGHNAPGGGFAGGLVMGAAVILRYLASGPAGIRSLRIDPILLMGVGLALALAVGVGSQIWDESFLQSEIWKFHLPLIGKVKFVSSSLFDIGVHILVLGVVMAILVAFVEADDEVARAQEAWEKEDDARSRPAPEAAAKADPGPHRSGEER